MEVLLDLARLLRWRWPAHESDQSSQFLNKFCVCKQVRHLSRWHSCKMFSVCYGMSAWQVRRTLIVDRFVLPIAFAMFILLPAGTLILQWKGKGSKLRVSLACGPDSSHIWCAVHSSMHRVCPTSALLADCNFGCLQTILDMELYIAICSTPLQTA
jgi:hypothetical protein